MKKKKMIFTKDSTIGDVVEYNEDLADILMGFGMHCLGCPMSQMETLEEAAQAHDIDLELMLEKLNENA
mgnify:FL=1